MTSFPDSGIADVADACEKKLALPGTYRALPFAETIDKALDVAKRIGITRVADVTGLDSIGVPVAMAIRPASRSLSVSQGKGLSLDAAKASALMEAIEYHHAEHITLPLRLASLRELAVETDVAHVRQIAQPVNSRFHVDTRIPWVAADVVGVGEQRWVPYECLDLDRVAPSPYLAGCFHSDTGGLASGNTRSEAMVHALCELIEHDAEALWMLAGPAHRLETRLDLSSITDATNLWLLDKIHAAGLAIGVWDMTSDIKVSSFAAVIVDPDLASMRRQPPTAGFGTHLDATVALSRAITEAIQSRATIITGSRDDIDRSVYRRLRGSAHLKDMADLINDPYSPQKFASVNRVGGTFDEDVETLLGDLLEADIQPPLVVDLTHPEYGIPVVKCIAPGLECERSEADHAVVHHGPRGRAAKREVFK